MQLCIAYFKMDKEQGNEKNEETDFDQILFGQKSLRS